MTPDGGHSIGQSQLVCKRHDRDLATQRVRLERLEAEEAKLLQAHYSDAISLSLLQKEQRRIAGERRDASRIVAAVSLEKGAMERSLELALERVTRCDEAYADGSDRVRRELCFTVFDRIFVDEGGVAGSNLAGPFAQLLDPDLPEWLNSERATLEDRVGELVDPAFAVDAHRPLEASSRLERPHGSFGWE